MKIRTGFVSNSSSSSFCIYGIVAEQSEVVDMLVANGKIQESEYEESLYDIIEGVLKDTNLDYFDCGDSDYIGIGVSFTSMPDDAVCGEWKKNIEIEMKQLLGDNIKCQNCEEAFYG